MSYRLLTPSLQPESTPNARVEAGGTTLEPTQVPAVNQERGSTYQLTGHSTLHS